MSLAARLAANCSGLLAPTMAELSPGWAKTQATASSTIPKPASLASPAIRSTAEKTA